MIFLKCFETVAPVYIPEEIHMYGAFFPIVLCYELYLSYGLNKQVYGGNFSTGKPMLAKDL